MRRPLAALAIGVACLGVAGECAAQTDAGAPTPGGSRIDEAQRHITEGFQRFRQRDYSGAIHEFELANAAVPTPELWFNIARAREMLTDYRGAVDDLRRYLRDKVDPPDRVQVERHIAELERLDEIRRASQARQAVGQTLRVEVEGDAAASTVSLDGQAQQAAALTTPTATTEGVHRVEVTRPGMQPWVARVRVRPGEAAAVFANPARATVYRTRAAPHIASAVLGGLGLVALGVSGYFAVSAATEDCAGCNAQWEAAHRSDIFLGTGAALAVGAAVAFFIERASGLTVTQR